jgi:hypothetical protein
VRKPYWAHYAFVNDDLGGCWQAMTVGPIAGDVQVVGSIGAAPLLGVWDHEPTVQEIDAVTPWDWRTICPACGSEVCDDEMHTLENWCEQVPNA